MIYEARPWETETAIGLAREFPVAREASKEVFRAVLDKSIIMHVCKTNKDVGT